MNQPGGGAERVLADVASGICARGHQVAVLSFDPPGGRSFYEMDPRIERITIGSARDLGFLGSLRRIRKLRKCVRVYQPSLAIGFMHSMFIPLGIALIGTSISMIASEHIVLEHYHSRPLQKLLFHLTPLLADRIVCVSEQARNSFPPHIRRNMLVLENPVTVNSRNRAKVSVSNGERKILLTVGRLEPQKDHETLIKAFARIDDQAPDWDLRIVGDGKLRSKLTSLVAELGLENRVCLAGTKQDIIAEYLSAQLFVISSCYESFGIATAEALSHGLPAVGFDDCIGTNQLIRSGINGALARGDGRRVESLATTLLDLMKNDGLRISMAEQARGIPSQCRIANVLIKWEALIRESVSN